MLHSVLVDLPSSLVVQATKSTKPKMLHWAKVILVGSVGDEIQGTFDSTVTKI